MIRFKALDDPIEWQWMFERTKVVACADSQGIVAVDDCGKIAACVLMDTWTPDSCSVHMAIDNPMAIKAGLFTEVAVHVYVTCGRKRMFGLVPDDNARALKLDKRIGFREVTRIPDAIKDGVGYVVMRLDKADCRWLPAEFREEAA